MLIIILVVAITIVSYIAFKKESAVFDDILYQKRINELEAEKDSLLISIEKGSEKEKKYIHTVDSLQNLKPKIQYVYIEKYKFVDNANIVSNDSLLRASLGIR